MPLVTDPTEMPDEQYHTVIIEAVDNHFDFCAISSDTVVKTTVGSVALGGTSAGVVDGDVKLDAERHSHFQLEHVDFTDEHGYEEIQITFEERE